MKVTFDKSSMTVEKEHGDKNFYNTDWASGESTFLHCLKKVLNNCGFDLIKKRMWKDGHLVDADQLYLRTRNPSGDSAKDIMLYNAHWQINGLDKDWNQSGKCTLALVQNCFSKED
uniref:Uncharacterized protein n=1 Tax=viral metagenome TaxID=1070528 RepID=A0A6M3JS70_9ZZZZ